MEAITVIRTSEQIEKITEALALAQGEIEAASRDSENPYFGSSYSSLAAIKSASRPHLAKNGLAVFQATASELGDATGKVYVTTRLAHSSGQWVESTLTMPVLPMARKKKDGDSDSDRAPGKITAQAVGSALTYGMRYGYSAMVGVVPEADDDDGNAASAGGDGTLPIPANGYIEDVILTVHCEEKDKRDGGKFVVCTVETSKYGSFECWESVGNIAKEFAGSATLCELNVEKSKYGPRLKNIRAKQYAPGEKELNEVKEAVAKAETLDDLSALKTQFKEAGGNYWTGHTFEVIKDRGRQLGAPETSAKPESEHAEPQHVRIWKAKVAICKTRPEFDKLQAEWESSPEIKQNQAATDALTAKGIALKVEGYV